MALREAHAPCREQANLRRTNFLVPFAVSNLGVLAAARTARGT